MWSTNTNLAQELFPVTSNLPPAPSPNDLLSDLANDPPEPEPVGPGIFKLFERAISRRLKYPKIRLRAADGAVFVLRRAGAKSKHAGQVQILGEGRYPASRYFGRIDVNGLLYPSRAMTPAVNDLLARFAADPAKVAFEYGRLMGKCCFCNAPLSDPRSTAHGYGPVCAFRYGLAWNAQRSEHGFHGCSNDGLDATSETVLL